MTTSTVSTTEQELWQDLEASPESDVLRLILADLLQEPGCSTEQEELALALRWAVSKGKWPGRALWEDSRPYPWLWRREGGWGRYLPQRLPTPVFEAIPDCVGGESTSLSLRQAYTCLGRALATLREMLACP